MALTTDIGEGLGRWSLGDDDALLEIVTSANIACGFHGGDPGIMRRTCATAVGNGVAIGAQVGSGTCIGDGRRYIAIPGRRAPRRPAVPDGRALRSSPGFAGGKVDFIRAHGALYNVAAKNTEHAQALVDATVEFDKNLPLLCQVGTEAWRLGEEAGLRLVAEAFVDRAYTPEGLLQPRTEPNALLEDADEAAARAVQLATDGRITANDGSEIEVKAEALLGALRHPGSGGDRPQAPVRRWRRRGRRSCPSGDGRRRSPLAEPPGSCAGAVTRAGCSTSTDNDEVHRWAAAVRDAGLVGVREVVPGLTTLLVTFDAGGTRHRPRCERAGRPGARTRGALDAGRHVLDVRYDGEDLEEVARLTGSTPTRWSPPTPGCRGGSPSAGSRPASPTWSVAIRGWGCHAGRSRGCSVPPGAVAIAGEFSSVYPRASPAGGSCSATPTPALGPRRCRRRPCCCPAPSSSSGRVHA